MEIESDPNNINCRDDKAARVLCPEMIVTLSDHLNTLIDDQQLNMDDCSERKAKFIAHLDKMLFQSYTTGYNDGQSAPKKKSSRMKRPTLEEVEAYFKDKKGHNGIEFYEFYESNGWIVGKTPMKKWQLAASRWIRNNQNGRNNSKGLQQSIQGIKPEQGKYSSVSVL